MHPQRGSGSPSITCCVDRLSPSDAADVGVSLCLPVAEGRELVDVTAVSRRPARRPPLAGSEFPASSTFRAQLTTTHTLTELSSARTRQDDVAYQALRADDIPNAYARYTGTAPLPVWSSNRARHRLSRTGNRQLNAALHRMALTQMRVRPPAKAMIERRRAVGDGGGEALRVLKRRLSDVAYQALRADLSTRRTQRRLREKQATDPRPASDPRQSGHRSGTWGTRGIAFRQGPWSVSYWISSSGPARHCWRQG